MKAILFVAAAFVGAIGASFVQSLPIWCANPAGGGNWIVFALGFCA